MHKSLLLSAIVAVTALAACSSDPYSPANSAAGRTLGGAAVGALAAEALDGKATTGALVGAVAGGVSCSLPNTVDCH